MPFPHIALAHSQLIDLEGDSIRYICTKTLGWRVLLKLSYPLHKDATPHTIRITSKKVTSSSRFSDHPEFKMCTSIKSGSPEWNMDSFTSRGYVSQSALSAQRSALFPKLVESLWLFDETWSRLQPAFRSTYLYFRQELLLVS